MKYRLVYIWMSDTLAYSDSTLCISMTKNELSLTIEEAVFYFTVNLLQKDFRKGVNTNDFACVLCGFVFQEFIGTMIPVSIYTIRTLMSHFLFVYK